MRISRAAVVTCFVGIALGLPAYGQANKLYGNSAGSNRIDTIDPQTGALLQSCSPGKGNGRGIVVVGNVAYFTVADSNNIYMMDINTCADLGVAFSVPGVTGLSTIAFDGTNFWVGDYSGPNKAYYFSPTGTLLNTVTLANCTSYCDGLEFFNGKLISNRGDAVNAPYDVYDTNGNLLQPAFITPGFQATGIAFDGTNFYVSDIFNSQVGVFDGNTGAYIKTVTLTGGSGFLIEDLSFDYQERPDTGGGGQAIGAPTLGQGGLAVLCLAMVGGGARIVRRRRRRA